MQVTMLTNVAGIPSYHAGETVDLEDRIAKAWIDDGLAKKAPRAPESGDKVTK